VTTALLVFVIFLSLKNTPLAILTTYSYERLNFFHRVAGYALIACTMSHTVVMLVAVSLPSFQSTSFVPSPIVTQLTIFQWARVKDLSEFLLIKNVDGMVAGSAMLVILATATLLRKGQYETFHIVHITMVALILITAAMHRPDVPMVGKIVIVAASLWIADRILRLLKLAFNGFGNSATITPLPYGGTRIVMRKTPMGAVPGTHCFLWIPGVRATESHPFTILSTTPFEMVVAAYDGFTRDLHTHAMENPGKVLKASVDGPYGTVPDFTRYSKVLFIAGGSGASFACGAAVDLLRRLGDSTATAIEFVWVVKEQGKS
jgi:predicted ferric reductase